jgi:serine/threonine protein kinase
VNPELLEFHERVVQCKQPEDLFGSLGGGTKTSTTLSAQISATTKLTALKALYRRFAVIAHVDKYTRLDEQRIAHIAFTRLNDLHQQAIDKVNGGIYGTKAAAPKKNSTPPSMKSKKGIYVVTTGLAAGDLSTVYRGEFDGKTPVIIKMAKHHTLNDLIENEAKVLTKLNEAAAGTVSYKQFIPTLLDHFTVKVAPSNAVRHVNILQPVDGFRPLTDIIEQYPDGIDQRHFVWIFNRLLTTLSFVHSQGIVHGAVLPEHVLVHPVSHAIHLIDWSFAVSKGATMKVISTKYADWYPPEVTAKRVTASSTDIFMAARCMLYILDIDPNDMHASRTKVHPRFIRLLESCFIKNPLRRPTSAWELYKDFGVIAEDLWGPRKYLKLEMA